MLAIAGWIVGLIELFAALATAPEHLKDQLFRQGMSVGFNQLAFAAVLVHNVGFFYFFITLAMRQRGETRVVQP